MKAKYFIQLAGQCDSFHAEFDSLPDRGESLCNLQVSQAARGYRCVELVLSIYGWTVRYNSGLQDRAILYRSKDKDPAKALEYALEYVSFDPAHREANVRISNVERCEKQGYDCQCLRDYQQAI